MAGVSYKEQTAWREIMAALPSTFHLKDADLPAEEVWTWRGNEIHLDRYEAPEAPAKVILHHGVGTNGRQMSILVGHQLTKRGYAVVAPDNLGYGVSQVSEPLHRYDDWLALLSDLIDAELQRDGKPVFLFGLSAGGMLSFCAAGKNGKVRGVIGLTFIDERIYQVRKETVLHPVMAPFVPLTVLMGRLPLANRIKVPMKWMAKMHTLVNDGAVLRRFLKDPTSSGAWVSLAFLSSFLAFRPPVEVEDFDVCPVLLAQPAQDRWTPEHLSTVSLKGLTVEFSIEHLAGAGHYPYEPPGHQQLLDHMVSFIERHSAEC